MKADLSYSWLVRLTFGLNNLCGGKRCAEGVETKCKFSLDFLRAGNLCMGKKNAL